MQCHFCSDYFLFIFYFIYFRLGLLRAYSPFSFYYMLSIFLSLNMAFGRGSYILPQNLRFSSCRAGFSRENNGFISNFHRHLRNLVVYVRIPYWILQLRYLLDFLQRKKVLHSVQAQFFRSGQRLLLLLVGDLVIMEHFTSVHISCSCVAESDLR